MIIIGTEVRVKEPFMDTFPGVYRVSSIDSTVEGGPVYFLEGVESGFDLKFLEAC